MTAEEKTEALARVAARKAEAGRRQPPAGAGTDG